MHRFAKHSVYSGSLLLAAFLLGGVLAPALHTVQHGLEWAETQATAHACDHSAHAATFEDAHAIVHLDICPFCLHRMKASVEAPPPQHIFAALERVYHPKDYRYHDAAPNDYGARAPPPTS